MPKFQIGDTVQENTSYLTVAVIEIGVCEDYERLGCHPETFRYKDPETGEDDWAHSDEFSLELP
jgi:hypothetical protein